MNMNIVMLVVLIILTIIMSMQNFKRIKQYKKDKTYIDLYTKVLKGEENVDEELKKYIENESDPCLNTKARIVKAYNDILLERNPSEDLKDLDIKNIYYVNGKFSEEKSKLNSEIFVWLTLMLSKARCLSMIDLMNELYEKVQALKDDLNVLVEYQVFNAAYNSLLEKGIDGIDFLKKLLNGDYGNYVYDKNLIGIYKKIACCLLVFTGEPIEKDDEAMLSDFTGTLVGNRFTRDLEIYDRFAPKNEDPNVNDTNDSKDVKEELKETETPKNEDVEKPKEEQIEEIKNDEDSTEIKEELNDDKKEDVEETTVPSIDKDRPKTEKSDEEVESLKRVQDDFLDSIGDIGEE